MKTVYHPSQQRNKLGLYYEKILHPALELAIGESLVKTEDRYDVMDFQGKNCFVELKTRGDQYHYSQSFIKKDGWIIPYCKIEKAKEEVAKGKRVIFFYFWTAGKSLWRWDFSEKDLLGCKIEYPKWHHDLQQQIYIQEKNWKQVY